MRRSVQAPRVNDRWRGARVASWPARALVALALVAVPLCVATAGARAALRTGCDSTRPAVGYRPGGGALSPQPRDAPVPCLEVVSGRAGESATVAVTHTGRVLYAPIVKNDLAAPLDDRGPADLAKSDDGGASWQAVAPGSPDHVLDVPPWMTRDPATGRIWFASVLPGLCGSELSWSDDDGRKWTTNPAVGCPGMGSLRTLEGPAPAGGTRPTGYPHVVYLCSNLNDFSASNLWCYRSLDGGHSFAVTGGFPDPPPRPDCGTEHAARPGAVGVDGDLYFPVYQCGDLSVAISRDEGTTWQLVHVAESPVQDLYISSLAADDQGNLYLAWIAGDGGAGGGSAPGAPNPATEGILGEGTPMLSLSRDRGATWSAPAALAPPGTGSARHIAVTAEGSGQVAVSFLASADGGSHLNGYLAETPNALAPAPLWWAASLNDPRTPLLSTSDPETFGDRLFFITDAFSPQGQPWAAFHCAKTDACPGERIGVVGRLSTVSAARRRTATITSPSARRCLANGTLRIRAGAGVETLTLYLGQRRVRLVRGAALRRPIVLRGLPHARFRLRAVATFAGGRSTLSRTYRACARRSAHFTG